MPSAQNPRERDQDRHRARLDQKARYLVDTCSRRGLIVYRTGSTEHPCRSRNPNLDQAGAIVTAIEIDENKMEARIKSLPTPEETRLPFEVNYSLIVEFYTR